MTNQAYDALLLLSFGGPEGPDDVLPFLQNVTRGRGIPPERLAAVAEHYHHFGGVSPINGQNRALLAAIQADFAANGLNLPVYWGNRNWSPYLTDTLTEMAKDGVQRALGLVTSAYASYSGCRQYQDDIAAAREQIGPQAPTVDKLRHYFNHPGFLEPNIDAVRAAAATVPGPARLVCTAHSIPLSMARDSGPDGDLYIRELSEAARLVAEAVGLEHDLVWQSRSGPPQVPWLEPDINDHLESLARQGIQSVVVCPIGFVSDHMEVRWDLDEEAAATAERLGLAYVRAATAGTDPRFVAMVRELVLERLDPGCPRRSLGSMGPSHDTCPTGCCPGRRPSAQP
ncbi:MAG TPA: ferrochelatase [Mycobacteriales bacterium]|nr:ferrochelatase [Mycobacteriales bacterium]